MAPFVFLLLFIYMEVVNQQRDEDHWDQDVQIKRYPCVVRCVVCFDHYTSDVHHGISQPPHREPDHGSNPEFAPYPVAENPQSTDGEVRHSHLALEGIARRPADGCRSRIREDRVSYEGKNTREPNGYHEQPQKEDLRYPPFR